MSNILYLSACTLIIVSKDEGKFTIVLGTINCCGTLFVSICFLRKFSIGSSGLQLDFFMLALENIDRPTNFMGFACLVARGVTKFYGLLLIGNLIW